MIKILIVDDKTENLYLLQVVLESSGFNTFFAKNGAEALGLMRTDIPDLIIADILMPVMDGFTLCRECKKDEEFQNIPFFFYTATYVDAKDEEYALSLGADRFILKPQEPETFIKIINDFLTEEKNKIILPKKSPQKDEVVVLREYNEVLIRKIEDKMLQTEKAERALSGYAEELEREVRERKKNEDYLRKSEEYNRLLFTTSPTGLALCKMDGSLVDINPAYAKIIGRTVEETLKLSYWEITPERYAADEEEQLKKLRETGHYGKYEKEYLHKDGHLVPVQLQGIILERDGESFIWSSVEDITERKEAERMEDALHESEEKYRSIFDNSNIAILLTIPDGTVLSANEYACNLFRMTENEMREAGRDGLVLAGNELQSLLQEREIKGKAKGELTFLRKDGSSFRGEISSVVFLDKDGYKRTSMVIRDLTEQHKANEELLKNEARFRSYFESAIAGIAITSPSKGWVEVNDYLCRMLGYSKDEIFRYTWADLTHPEDLNMDLENFNQVTLGLTDAYSLEKRFIRKDGQVVWTNMSVRCVRNHDQTVEYFVALLFDISERKKFEDELIRAKIKAEESDKLKTAFLHNISHEIRTPMNAIVGFSELLAEPDIDEKSKISFANTIIHSSNQLLAIINDIIEIANIEAGILKCSKDDININLILQQLYDQFVPVAASKGLQFKKHFPLSDNKAICLADKTKFIQIITNLLSNAIKFTSHGDVEFGYSCSDDYLNFFVSDTGIGIPEDQLEKIFDRFYQVEHMMGGHFEGTGLGLSISKAYVELMGGHIWVDSDPGKGSIFYFTLPNNRSSKGLKETLSLSPEVSFRKETTILVAEDDEHNYNLILHFLHDPKLHLVRATNGVEALAYCESGKPVDLILMDLKMPEMDGYEATKKILGIRPDLPIIAQTAFVTDNEKVFNSGCVDIITKPFTRSSLLEKILQYLKD